MGFGQAGSAAGLWERPGPWPRGQSRACLPPLSGRPAPALWAWLSAGAAVQAEFPGAQAGSGSGRRSPENLLIRRGQRGSDQSASEGAGPARSIGLCSCGLAPGRAGPQGAQGRAGPPEGRGGEGRGRNFPPRSNPGCFSPSGFPWVSIFSGFLGDFSLFSLLFCPPLFSPSFMAPLPHSSLFSVPLSCFSLPPLLVPFLFSQFLCLFSLSPSTICLPSSLPRSFELRSFLAYSFNSF